MKTNFLSVGGALVLTAMFFVPAFAVAQGPASTPSPVTTGSAPEALDPNRSILLTIFLRHDQSRPLDELNVQLDRQGWRKVFPPAGVEIVSWYVMMGIGQVITLRLPPEKLREVNVAVERAGWGAYRTEFYTTYDYRAIGEAEINRVRSQPAHN